MKTQLLARLTSLLLVSETPLTLAKLQQYAQLDEATLKETLAQLEETLPDIGLQLAKVAEGWQIQVHPSQIPWVQQMLQVKAPRLSRVQLETLAIIAHRQPVTRAEIEHIRGVSVSSTVLQALQSYGWIKPHGHKDIPGKPALWITTGQLLIDLGLESRTALKKQLDTLIQQAQLEIQQDEQGA